jgi:hypothetical protein
MIDPAVEAAPTVQGEAVSIGPAVEADSVIWTARLKTGRVATFRASASRAFRAVALIASVAAGVDLAAAGLAASAVAGSGVGDENKCLEPSSNFFVELIKQRTHTNQNI